MITIAQKPFLEYLLLHLRKHDVRRIILCIGYRGEHIQEHFGDGKCLGLYVNYSWESELLGTGGAVKLAEPLIESSDFVVLNGDSFFNINLHTLIGFHRKRKALATIALAGVKDTQRYGSVEINDQGEVTGFLEKAYRGPGVINGGIYVFQRKLLSSIPDGRVISLERDVFPQLVGHGFHGISFESYFVDIGVPGRYRELQTDPSQLLATVA